MFIFVSHCECVWKKYIIPPHLGTVYVWVVKIYQQSAGIIPWNIPLLRKFTLKVLYVVYIYLSFTQLAPIYYSEKQNFKTKWALYCTIIWSKCKNQLIISNIYHTTSGAKSHTRIHSYIHIHFRILYLFPCLLWLANSMCSW